MVTVDTNVLVRWLVRDDEKLVIEADRLFDQAQPASILLDRIVLAELCYVLKSVYDYKKFDIVANLTALLNDPRFSVIDRLLVENTVNIFGLHSQLSPEDSWLLALEQSNKAEKIWTFDKALAKLSTN